MGHVWFVDANHVADPRAVGAPDDFPRAYDVAKRSTDGIADPHIAADDLGGLQPYQQRRKLRERPQFLDNQWVLLRLSVHLRWRL